MAHVVRFESVASETFPRVRRLGMPILAPKIRAPEIRATLKAA